MKTSTNTVQVWDKVIGKFKVGLASKTISKALENLPKLRSIHHPERVWYISTILQVHRSNFSQQIFCSYYTHKLRGYKPMDIKYLWPNSTSFYFTFSEEKHLLCRLVCSQLWENTACTLQWRINYLVVGFPKPMFSLIL